MLAQYVAHPNVIKVLEQAKTGGLYSQSGGKLEEPFFVTELVED